MWAEISWMGASIVRLPPSMKPTALDAARAIKVTTKTSAMAVDTTQTRGEFVRPANRTMPASDKAVSEADTVGEGFTD